MVRRITRLLAFTFAAALFGAPSAAALSLNDSLPALPPSPATIAVAAGESTVYRVALGAGETLKLSLSPAAAQPAALDADLFLFAPSATENLHASAIARAAWPAASYPETIAYGPASAGTYYVEVYGAESSGDVVLTWSVIPEQPLPVYRFYNKNSGTHFYTPSLDEANTVVAKWSNVFDFEGIAYTTRASRNYQPLYRFYNKRNGSHFYTASPEEKASVMAKYSATFAYEGETYLVSPANDGTKAPVYRFYNVRNGSHFFTASAEERDAVMARWGNTYSYEGPAFYLGQ